MSSDPHPRPPPETLHCSAKFSLSLSPLSGTKDGVVVRPCVGYSVTPRLEDRLSEIKTRSARSLSRSVKRCPPANRFFAFVIVNTTRIAFLLLPSFSDLVNCAFREIVIRRHPFLSLLSRVRESCIGKVPLSESWGPHSALRRSVVSLFVRCYCTSTHDYPL